MAKLFKQKFELDESENFYIIAENKKEAEEVFDDSVKEVMEDLQERAIPLSRTGVELVSKLTKRELKELDDEIWGGGIIWNKEQLKNLLKNKGLKKLLIEVV